MSSVETTPLRDPSDALEFDFRHPSTLSREDARALQLLQESFAHGVGTTLASSIRASIDVQIAAVEQIPYGELVRRTPNPSAIAMLRLDPVSPQAMLQIDPAISFAIVELLVGGSNASEPLDRAHSEIEDTLLRSLLQQMLPTLDEAFQGIAPVQSSLVGQESNPTFVQIASATDMVVAISLTVEVDGVPGSMCLAVPVRAMRPYLDELRTEPDAEQNQLELINIRQRVTEHLGQVDVVAAVRFDPLVASSRQLVDLEVGDVLRLEHEVDAPLVFEIEGVAVHDVTLGRLKRHLAIEVGGAAPERPRRPSRMTLVDPDSLG
ncbi:MAG: flagellar motor switch protein FliM [Ilumatobacter sp.]